MMRYGIPAFRLPRDVLDAEIDRILGAGRHGWRLGQTVTDLAGVMAQGRFDAAFLAVGAQLSQRAYIPAGDAARILDAVRCLHEVGRGRAAAARPAGRGLRRRQHRHGRGQDRAAARRRPTRSWSTGGPGTRCRRTTARCAEADRGGRHAALAVHHRRGPRTGPLTIEKMRARRDRVPAADRGVRGARGGRGGPRPRPGRRSSALLDGVPGVEFDRRRGPGRPEHDDRPPRPVRRRGHGPVRAHRRPSPSATARRPPGTSTPGCAATDADTGRQARAGRPSARSTRGTTATRRPPSGRELEAARRVTDLRRGGRRPRRVDTRCTRPAAACPAATASSATTASASARTTR